MDLAYCNKCGKRYSKNDKNPSVVCDRCAKDAHKLLTGNVGESIYRLVSARDISRSAGQYVNRLRSIINIGYEMLPESEWREMIGDDKFEEALRLGLFILEDTNDKSDDYTPPEELERKGKVIKEQPVEIRIKEIVYYKNDGDSTVYVIKVTNGNDSGMMRLAKSRDRYEWTTDNIDLITDDICEELKNIDGEFWKYAPNSSRGKDTGPLPYVIKLRYNGTD